MEFPPIINGGLGVACLGMARAMSKAVDLSIILPKTDPSFVVDNVELIGLNQITTEQVETIYTSEEHKEFKDVSYIDSTILPYESYVEEEVVVSKKKETNDVKSKTSG